MENMANTFSFFNKIVCISADENRWKLVSEQFDLIGISEQVERIEAIVPYEGFTISNSPDHPKEIACSLSHLKAMFSAIETRCDNILIFEDDIKFKPGIGYLASAIETLPTDWDIFFLGCRPRDYYTRLNPMLVKMNFCTGGYAYALNGQMLYQVYKKLLNSLLCKNEDVFTPNVNDVVVGSFCQNGKAYAMYPPGVSILDVPTVMRGDDMSPILVEYHIEEDWKKYGRS